VARHPLQIQPVTPILSISPPVPIFELLHDGMLKTVLADRNKMRPPAPDQHPPSDRSNHATTSLPNDAYLDDTHPVTTSHMRFRKKKSIAALFKFGGRGKKSAGSPKTAPGISYVSVAPMIPEIPVDTEADEPTGPMRAVMPSSADRDVIGTAELQDGARAESANQIEKVEPGSRDSFSSGTTSHKSALSLFDSLRDQSRSDSLTTTLTEESTDNEDNLANKTTINTASRTPAGTAKAEAPTSPTAQSASRKRRNGGIVQNDQLRPSAIQLDGLVDSKISEPALNKGKAVATASPSQSFDYSTARRWSWDEDDMESEGQLTLWNDLNDACNAKASAVTKATSKQHRRDQYLTPAAGTSTSGGRYTRTTTSRALLPYTRTIYQARPRSNASASSSKAEGTNSIETFFDALTEPVSEDMNWLEIFIREEEAEMAKIVEQDRLLAEELQRIENERAQEIMESKDIEELIRKLDEEEDAVRQEELSRIYISDLEFAAELARQEQEELEAELRQEREERERLEEEERQRKKREEEERRKIGVPIQQRQVNMWGRLNNVDGVGGETVTPEMVETLKRVKELFVKGLPTFNIHQIDLIVNPKLQEAYEQTRQEFQRLGRSTTEAVLFHGTNPKNVDSYPPHLSTF
jgi:hypothetical protein